jgi:septum formation protein
MTKSKRIILASTSPFRKKLLNDAGLGFEAMAPKADEKTIAGLPPSFLAAKRAEFKAIDVALHAPPDSLVIGADQVLSLDGMSFDKAETEEEARQRLRQFRGKTHTLHSAFCLVEVHHSGSCETVFETVVDVPMTMRHLSDQEIEDYLATREWEGCVGCYRAEGEGRKLFSKIGGDESAVIGLPIKPLSEAIHQFTAH